MNGDVRDVAYGAITTRKVVVPMRNAERRGGEHQDCHQSPHEDYPLPGLITPGQTH